MRRARSWLSLLLVVILILVAAPPVMGQSQICADYVVVAGDTLFHIAQTYGLKVSDIISVNSIVDPSSIFAGQHLNIPCAGGNTAAIQQPSLIPALLPLNAQTITELRELYHRSLAATPVDLGVGSE